MTENTEPAPRLQYADRLQQRLDVLDLDSLIEPDHQARNVWMWVQQLDLSPLLNALKARGSAPGRCAIDPHILLCLWLYATLDGVGSARLLARLCTEHHAYRWIAGGVSLNYHTLSDFRVANTEFLDTLLTTSMAVLMEQGLVEMKAVAQDGMRVRASAGKSSFRAKDTLAQLHDQCRQQIQLLKTELDEQPDAGNKRQKAARERAQREREERLARAMANAKQLEEEAAASRERQRKKSKPEDANKKARASATDPDARVMKMANGGFEPGYNIQFVTDTSTNLILGYDVTNSGNDYKSMRPLNEQLKQRYGKRPEAILADAGYRQLEEIEAVEKLGTAVYLPLRKPKNCPKRIRDRDTPETRRWRQRMQTDEARELYKKRCSTAEFTNAQTRNQGLRQFCVRGLKQVKAIALWHALAINLRTFFRLGFA